jgi:hypothetical protein
MYEDAYSEVERWEEKVFVCCFIFAYFFECLLSG